MSGERIFIPFSYKNDKESKQQHSFKTARNRQVSDNKYENFKNNLEENGIGVRKIVDGANSVGLTVSQFAHPSMEIIEEIIYLARQESEIEKDVITNYQTANLDVKSNFNDKDFAGNIIYQAPKSRGFNYSNNIKFRPFLASRERVF